MSAIASVMLKLRGDLSRGHSEACVCGLLSKNERISISRGRGHPMNEPRALQVQQYSTVFDPCH